MKDKKAREIVKHFAKAVLAYVNDEEAEDSSEASGGEVSPQDENRNQLQLNQQSPRGNSQGIATTSQSTAPNKATKRQTNRDNEDKKKKIKSDAKADDVTNKVAKYGDKVLISKWCKATPLIPPNDEEIVLVENCPVSETIVGKEIGAISHIGEKTKMIVYKLLDFK